MRIHGKAESDASKISKRDGQRKNTEEGYTGNWRVKEEEGRRWEKKREENKGAWDGKAGVL